jgi:hypothetical protein
MLASASDRATPVWAVRSAPQSLPPSPHMPTTTPDAMKLLMTAIWGRVRSTGSR